MLKLDDNDWFRAVAFATMLISSISIFWYSLINPIDHWDMLGYAASLMSLTGMDIGTLHETVYSEMQNFTSKAKFEELVGSTSYRVSMYQDAEAFAQQIPFFKIRVLFIWMLDLVAQLFSWSIGASETTYIQYSG